MAEVEEGRPQGNTPLFGGRLPAEAPNPNGATMAAVHARTIAERQRLVASGLMKPFTLINFNPVDLRIEAAIIPWWVPRFNDPVSKKKIEVTINGKTRTGCYITIGDAILRPKIRDVKKAADQDDPVADYDVMSILPVEQAFQFWNEYYGGDNPMGGLLAFEGDVHVVESKGKKEFRIPKFTTLADHSRTYFSVPADLEEQFEFAIAMQRTYCDNMLERAYAMHQDPDQRKFIHNKHHDWAAFSLSMGWIQKLPDWVFSSIKDSEVCDGCGAVKKHPKALFCVCGRPYNAFDAYMAGEEVAPVYLMNLSKEQQAKVIKEAERRRQFADLLGGVKPAAKSKTATENKGESEPKTT